MSFVNFEKSDLPRTIAGKGKAWIRKTYRSLKFTSCKDCGSPFLGRVHKCQSCIDAEIETKRHKECTICGEVFRLKDGQSGVTRICPDCKEEDIYWCYKRTILYFDEEFFKRISSDTKRMERFALKARNDIQSITEYSEFKKDYVFENVDWKIDTTYDHINSMSYILSNFIKKCNENPKLKNYEYFRNYLLKYGCQFRTSQKQNYDLIQYQKTGVTPEEYISVVGNSKNKTKEETIAIIKKHFINHG